MAESESTRLYAIVLAAGRGRRFGGGKLTAPFRGQPLIAGALTAAFAAPAHAVLVALGDDSDLEIAVKQSAAALGRSADLQLIRVVNPDQGMGASLRSAAQALPHDAAGVFVFLGDMPLIRPAAVSALAAALDRPDKIIAPIHDNQRGHPVLFGRDWIPLLQSLEGDTGAQGLIRQAGKRCIALATDDAGVLLDIDHPEDLARASRG